MLLMLKNELTINLYFGEKQFKCLARQRKLNINVVLTNYDTQFNLRFVSNLTVENIRAFWAYLQPTCLVVYRGY